MSQKSARKCLIITTITFAVVGVLGVLPAMTSVFLFDAPGSDKNHATIVLFVSALTLPIMCLVSIVLSWILYALKRFTAACGFAFLPVLNLVAVAAALLWLQVFNGGRFN